MSTFETAQAIRSRSLPGEQAGQGKEVKRG